MKDLKKKKELLEENIKNEKDMIKNNKSYDNEEQNMSYGSNHYKKAVKYDEEELKDVKRDIKMQDKIDEFKKASKKALSSKK